MIRLWPFKGGIHLEPRKEASTALPLEAAQLPRELIFPLARRDGRNARPLVEAGDRVLKGQVIAAGDGEMNPPIHASSSGVVRCIEARILPHPSGLAGPCIVVDVDGLDEPVAFQGVENYAECDPAILREKIHAAGIVGLGGAGFPTAVKVRQGPSRPMDLLVLNGAECEPYITCDDTLMRSFPREVLEGAQILMRMVGASECRIGVENDREEAIAALRRVNDEPGFEGIAIAPAPAIYPTGGERQLIKVLTGREVPSGGIPADVGVVCLNVGTAAAVRKAIVDGEPLISRIVTVTGEGIRQPRNLIARLGTPIADLVRQCGGYTERAERLILGGPMMGLALPSDDLPITQAANCILATGAESSRARPAMPCIRCGECAQACPVDLLPQQLYWYSRASDLDKVRDYQIFDCIECGCCDYVCPSHIPLVHYFRAAKGRIAARDEEREKADHARLRFEARQSRKDREGKERAESARRKKELLERSKGPAARE